jgi:hypothetical protein
MFWFLQIPCLRERIETAVEGLFRRRRETAAGQLFAFKVILQAFTANPLAAAPRVTARTEIHIFIFFAFHH